MGKTIGRMITVVYRKSQSYLSLALSKYNLTMAEEPFFAALQENDGVTQEEISSLLSIDKAATSRAVKSLEEKGFLKRTQAGHDRRQNRIFLTEAGRQRWSDVHSELIRYNSLLMQNIDKDIQDIIYDSLLVMEENIINMAKTKLKSQAEGD